MRRVAMAGMVAILVSIDAGSAAAAVHSGVEVAAAGVDVPMGTLWLIAPMLIAVAGAITVGWRRAATEARGGTEDR